MEQRVTILTQQVAAAEEASQKWKRELAVWGYSPLLHVLNLSRKEKLVILKGGVLCSLFIFHLSVCAFLSFVCLWSLQLWSPGGPKMNEKMEEYQRMGRLKASRILDISCVLFSFPPPSEGTRCGELAGLASLTPTGCLVIRSNHWCQLYFCGQGQDDSVCFGGELLHGVMCNLRHVSFRFWSQHCTVKLPITDRTCTPTTLPPQTYLCVLFLFRGMPS